MKKAVGWWLAADEVIHILKSLGHLSLAKFLIYSTSVKNSRKNLQKRCVQSVHEQFGLFLSA
jgi:hypothetical protein